MYHIYKGTKIYYELIGDGDIPIVFLHGWGGSSESFNFIVKDLKFRYKALFVDFPPFGLSQEPKCNFDIFDYANLTMEIINCVGFKKPIIVGHSFGGRVALIIGNIARFLILTSSAGLKPRRSIVYYYKIYKHKILKKLGKNSNGGSDDYKSISNNMKKTFVNIVSTNLEKYAININVPTILFWGKKDKSTPYYMAKRLNKLIKDSKIISFKDAGHFCYLEKYPTFLGVINSIGDSFNIN